MDNFEANHIEDTVVVYINEIKRGVMEPEQAIQLGQELFNAAEKAMRGKPSEED